jgi:hypothetical protein
MIIGTLEVSKRSRNMRIHRRSLQTFGVLSGACMRCPFVMGCLAVVRQCARGRQRPARMVGHLGGAGVEDRRSGGGDRPDRGGQDPADRAVPQGLEQSAGGEGQRGIRGHVSAQGRARAGRDPGHPRGAGAGCPGRADGWPRCGCDTPLPALEQLLQKEQADLTAPMRDAPTWSPVWPPGAAPGGHQPAPRGGDAATRRGLGAASDTGRGRCKPHLCAGAKVGAGDALRGAEHRDHDA